ncbi:probable multidrug resistance-associated protein lethal(2)03659 [Macrosteles quadrilineatus]|uniref:probable multidrug resistance-associated protein lethal(2)03659 n=1 Tax=Macrosteles quadrilineatus TaxID=74068 RepID=UPI0023E092BA|nr:probable multidrug resistance-associated protein lethal(2)03659 [Macrosteles quadrilineatus]
MEKENKEFYNKPSPYITANLFSKLTFSWTFKTFWKGYKRDLDSNDLFTPLDEHRSSKLGDCIEKLWNKKCAEQRGHKRKPSLFRLLLRIFGLQIFSLSFVLALMEVVVKVSQPLFLGGLIEYFRQNSGVTIYDAYLSAAGIVVCSAINVLVIHPYMMGIMHVGMKMRLCCSSLVYRKALQLSKVALNEATVGRVVNLVSNDVGRLDGCILFFPYLIIGPLQTMAVTYFLWEQIGLASVFGVAAMLTFIPIQVWLGKKTSSIRLRTAARTDKRVRLMNEIINGIQVIKMFTWEDPFTKLISDARRAELKEISKSSYIRGILSSFTIFHIRIAIFVSLLAYVFSGSYINATKVYIVTSYYNVLQHTMTIFMPKAITQGAEALVSIKRLQDFLNSAETEAPTLSREDKEAIVVEQDEISEVAVERKPQFAVSIMDGVAKWTTSQLENSLVNVNLNVRSGQLVAVIGSVGCGKTSLLQVILRELPLSSGSIHVSGKLSYASQEPWLFAGSVRQNILFGAPYDKQRYQKVVEVCALWQDFKQLFAGDKTIVGDRGVSLSGGQKARINLARAVYKQADIYLLDDPLSAVDPRVGKHIFQECIKGFLKTKTVLLVTHQLQHLDGMQHIVLMQGGRVVDKGTFRELQASGQQFSKLLLSSIAQEAKLSLTPEEPRISRTRLTSHQSICSSVDGIDNEDKGSVESYATGRIRSYVFTEYFSAAGNMCRVVLMLLLCLMTQLLANGGDYWVTHWVNLEEYAYPRQSVTTTNTTTVAPHFLFYTPRDVCVTVFAILTVAMFVVTLLRSYLFFFLCMRSSMKLHIQMVNSVTRATMHFFHNTSSGRILNRFSKDIGNIDESLPNALIECIQRSLTLLGVILVVAVVNPWVLLPTAIIAFLLYLLRKMYLSTSRAVKRLESVARSPVFAHLNASLQGLTTIRAFGAQHILTQEYDYHQDVHSSAWFMFLSSSRAFGMWLDMVCLLYIIVVVFGFLLLNLNVFGGVVGLSITQAMGLTGMLQFSMRQSAELENIMTSVERVLEYWRLDCESTMDRTEDNKLCEMWPGKGMIEFHDVSLSYSLQLPRVLKNISLVIKPKEKIGIVGRTGAGKSSLISALFRLHDIEGKILIDGVDTQTISLQTLRSSISIIPQEPVLFSGGLRSNLDPFNQFSDEQLWNALSEVELKDTVKDLEGGLDWQLAEGGSNFSVGQRQLLCLARAVLRNNHILILDEATANVDPQTDALIQSTIRRKFADCTVLTIAHRLHTVMDSHRLMVLDSGVLVEFDHPWKLLHNQDGFLYRLVRESGRGAAQMLHSIASQNYQQLKKDQNLEVSEVDPNRGAN